MGEYEVRRMTREELDLAVEWAAEEGWNPGLADANAFFEADPGGYWCGVLNGEMIASISAVKYGIAFGFVGFYIVKPAFRGKGHGLELWNVAMASLAGCRNVGLDGVLERQVDYEKSGFRRAYGNVRYEGVTDGVATAREEIGAISEDRLEAVVSYDEPFFPADRRSFLRLWLRQEQSTALAAWSDGNVVGYGVLRPCRNGYKVGPLCADTAETAESLLLGLQSSVPPGEPFFLDLPERNDAALKLALKCGMRKVFETARMYTSEFPKLCPRLYGVTSLELG